MDASGLEEDFQRFRDEAITGALEVIYSRLWKQVEDLELQRAARLSVARECLEAAYSVVDLAYPSRQKAAVTPISMMCGSWEPDEEPERPALERWVTGYLGWLSRKENITAAVGGRPETGSPPITPNSSRLSSRPVSPAVWPTEVAKVPDNLDEPVPIKTESLACAQPDSMVDERLREEIALRKQQTAAQEALREQDEAERERLAALRSRLRGRTYAYDHRGQVVLVAPIDPQRLPRPMTPIVRQTQSQGRRSGAGGGTGKGSTEATSATPASAGAAQAKAKGKRKKGPATTDYIERPRDTGPSPLDAIQLQPGVSLKGTHGAKSGPPLKSDPSNMSRAEFVAYAAKKNKASRAAAAMYPTTRTAAGVRSGVGGGSGSGGSAGGGGPRASVVGPASAQAPAAAGVHGAGEANEAARPGGTAESGGSAGTGVAPRGPGATERPADPGVGSCAGGTGARRRSGEAGGREGASEKGSAGCLERGARPGAQPAQASRERGLKVPLRRRTDDVPEWIQQGKLKPLSARSVAGRAAGGGRAGAASRRLPPVSVPASTAGFEPPPGMPVTKPTRASIASTIGRTDRLPRSRAEKPTCAPPRSRSASPSRLGGAEEGDPPVRAET